MLYYWWLYAVLAPLVALDILYRASPFYWTVWPVGLEYLARGRYDLGPTVPLAPAVPSASSN